MIKTKVRFASYLQEITGAWEEAWQISDGSNIYELIDKLIACYGKKLEDAIYGEDGEQRPGLRILLNGRDIRFLDDEKLVLSNGDIVLILPVLAGG
ncbi:MAG TPA: MoaD/ThiS family protein [Tepidimicrobium sp.]|nr:MoaD/ThiS family protein [Tepidimicrobium sp.]